MTHDTREVELCCQRPTAAGLCQGGYHRRPGLDIPPHAVQHGLFLYESPNTPSCKTAMTYGEIAAKIAAQKGLKQMSAQAVGEGEYLR